MAIQRIAFQCEHKCTHKMLISKEAMERHEVRCFRNPENKACITCIYFQPHTGSSSPDFDDGDVRRCLKDVDISLKLQSKCANHLYWDDVQ